MKKDKITANLLVFTILVALIANASAGFNLAFAQTPVPVSDAYVTASGIGYGTDSSNSQGFYNITSFLDTGNYSVEASATGFIDTAIEDVPVTAGMETPNINILMPVSGGISGHITDAVSGSPLQSVIVQAINITGSVQYGSTAFADSNGNYQIITNLATGIYNVTATSYSTGHITKTISGVSVTAGVMTNNVDIALGKSAIISGTVRDSVTNAVLQGIYIYALTPSGSYVTAQITNSSGQYTLDTDLGTGTYNISAILPANHLPKTIGGVAVVGGNQYTVDMLLDPSGILSGRITSAADGSPLAGAFVSASGGGFFGYATTNETGYYRITDGLGTATYTLFASYGLDFNFLPGVSVTQGSETSNVDIQITVTPSGTIRGRVTNSTGSPMESVTVSADGDAGSGLNTTDSNGDYIIETGLGTGTYNVTVSETGFVEQTQTGISVTVNQVTSNINFQLQAILSGRISGLVQTLGTPIPEFHTELFMIVIFAAASVAIMIKKLKTPQIKPATPL